MGAGKTTVATLLAEKFNQIPLLENFDKHPFLDDFYSNMSLYAYETEIGFLLMHYHQIRKEFHHNKNNYIISDFYIYKDMLFAEANILNIKELSIFEDLFKYLSSQLLKPDLIIYLEASDNLLFSRVQNRSRENEKNIGLDYIQKINLEYKSYFCKNVDDIKTITVNMDKYDFLKDELALDMLIDRIQKILDIAKF
jgi:deoxyadenosine/deoxycytidine kinase